MAMDVLVRSSLGWVWFSYWLGEVLMAGGNRIALMVAALSFSSVALLPETLATKILSVRAAKMNREAGSFKYATRGDLNRGSTWQFLVRISLGGASLEAVEVESNLE